MFPLQGVLGRESDPLVDDVRLRWYRTQYFHGPSRLGVSQLCLDVRERAVMSI